MTEIKKPSRRKAKQSLGNMIKKFFSRKLLTLIGATILLCTGYIDQTTWVGIATVWMGAQAWLDSKVQLGIETDEKDPE